MTTSEALDAPLIELTDPSLVRPLAPALVRARTDVIAAARDLLAVPESALARPWAWIGGSEVDVRYGAYRAAEALEQAEVEARHKSGVDANEGRAGRIIAPATAARWDLHGLVLPLDEGLLDADCGGEWSIRLVLGHVIGGQRAYGWGTSWWLSQGLDQASPDLPSGAPEAFWANLPDEATTEAAGSIEELRERLDTVMDLGSERLAGLPDERVGLGARWAGFPVTIGFRLGRWSSHIREHTIQLEKTLALLGYVPTEPARLVRLVLAAYGRAESVVFGRRDRGAAAERIAEGAAEARAAVHDAREAAEA